MLHPAPLPSSHSSSGAGCQQPAHSDSMLPPELTWPGRGATFPKVVTGNIHSPGLHQARPEAFVRESSSWK